MEKMKSMVEKFMKLCETQPKDTTIRALRMKIDMLYHYTISKISDIRLEINGHIQELDIVSSSAAIDSVCNTVTAVAKGYQLWNTFGNLSSLSKLLGVMSLGLHSIFVVWNAAVFVISQDELNELRKDLRHVNHLKEILDNLYHSVVSVSARMCSLHAWSSTVNENIFEDHVNVRGIILYAAYFQQKRSKIKICLKFS